MSPSTAPSKPLAAVLLTLAALTLLVAYALLSNWLMVHMAQDPWTLALLFGPLLLAVGGVGWAKRQWLTLVACAALLAVLIAVVLRGGVADRKSVV